MWVWLFNDEPGEFVDEVQMVSAISLHICSTGPDISCAHKGQLCSGHAMFICKRCEVHVDLNGGCQRMCPHNHGMHRGCGVYMYVAVAVDVYVHVGVHAYVFVSM